MMNDPKKTAMNRLGQCGLPLSQPIHIAFAIEENIKTLPLFGLRNNIAKNRWNKTGVSWFTAMCVPLEHSPSGSF